jgi:hypothetical protein
MAIYRAAVPLFTERQCFTLIYFAKASSNSFNRDLDDINEPIPPKTSKIVNGTEVVGIFLIILILSCYNYKNRGQKPKWDENALFGYNLEIMFSKEVVKISPIFS